MDCLTAELVGKKSVIQRHMQLWQQELEHSQNTRDEQENQLHRSPHCSSGGHGGGMLGASVMKNGLTSNKDWQQEMRRKGKSE